MYRIRSYINGAPLPNMDIKTGSWRVALAEARDKASRYGWDDVGIIIPGDRPLRGAELQHVCECAAP